MTGSEIAVIGLAARLPGARNAAEFWRNLREGVEAIQPLTDAELLAAGETPDVLRDSSYVKVQSALRDFDQFDAEFSASLRKTPPSWTLSIASCSRSAGKPWRTRVMTRKRSREASAYSRLAA